MSLGLIAQRASFPLGNGRQHGRRADSRGMTSRRRTASVPGNREIIAPFILLNCLGLMLSRTILGLKTFLY
jgi:hypothetical protein